jgi:hypothetical protein
VKAARIDVPQLATQQHPDRPIWTAFPEPKDTLFWPVVMRHPSGMGDETNTGFNLKVKEKTMLSILRTGSRGL